MQLQAFHGDKAIKARYLTRLRAHAAADELIHGVGWRDGKGCAIGCTLEKYQHSAYETELGIPQSLAYLEDALFEGLKNGEAQKFPIQFLSAIKPGADLSLVTPKFLLSLQRRNLRRMKGKNAEVEKVIEDVIKVLVEWVETGKPDVKAASAAAEAARAATWAARAASGAAEAAAWAARAPAEAAEAAAWAAGAAEYRWMAKTLLKLLREAA